MTFERSRDLFAVSNVHCTDYHDDVDACRYDVRWAINPHMKVGAVDFVRAASQHRRLTDVLTGLGARLIQLPFVHGAHDCVFTKDLGLMTRRGGEFHVAMASPRFGVRRREQFARAEHLTRFGYRVSLPPSVCWEGGDVVPLPDGRLLLGYGQRSHRSAARWLERHFDTEVIPLEIVDAHLYHLDVALTVLPDGALLVCLDAIAPASMRRLYGASGIADIVPVDYGEAVAFGLNVVFVGGTALLGGRSPGVERILSARGYSPVVVPLSEFQLAGGSAACLVARLHPWPSSCLRDDQPSLAAG